MSANAAEDGGTGDLSAEVSKAVDVALGRAIDLLPVAGPLASLRQSLLQYRARFDSLLRVALIGRVGSGKSTLVNALLGMPMVATGIGETTFNVNWLRYGTPPMLTIRYDDGQEEELGAPALATLEALTLRRPDPDGTFARIAYLLFTYPNANLAHFDLIDTPGIDSALVIDSWKTRRFLGLSGVPRSAEARASAEAESRAQAEADALIHVIASGPTATEQELLRDFQRAVATSEVASPIATVGALTMVENYWRADRQDVMTVGRAVACQLLKEGGTRRFYELQPVASLVAAAASTFSEQDFADLTALAKQVSPTVLVEWVQYGPRFSRDHSADLPVPAERRQALFELFRAHGITQACRLIRAGIASQEELRRELIARSGLADFREMLITHFGTRAKLIKAQRLIGQVADLAMNLRHDQRVALSQAERNDLDEAAAAVASLAYKVPAIAEFSVICDYHRGVLNFSAADAEQARHLLGEYGSSIALRLGLGAGAPAAELAARARALHRHWSDLDKNAAYNGFNGSTRRACGIVRRCCDDLVIATGRSGHIPA